MSQPAQWIVQRYLNWRVARASRAIASEAYPTVWQDVCRKITSPVREIEEYAKVRAAQVVHGKVDAMVRIDPSLDPAIATQLISSASQDVVRRVLQAVVSRSRRNQRVRRAA